MRFLKWDLHTKSEHFLSKHSRNVRRRQHGELHHHLIQELKLLYNEQFQRHFCTSVGELRALLLLVASLIKKECSLEFILCGHGQTMVHLDKQKKKTHLYIVAVMYATSFSALL